MSVNLKTLPEDEETMRQVAISSEVLVPDATRMIQNVLDGLNWYRCLAAQRENELREVRESAEHNRIFGRP